MLDRSQLEAFAAVIEHQSFERAAKALSVTRGAISQRIKLLEGMLSTILIIREQPISPTKAGEAVLRHVKTLRLLEHETYLSVAQKIDVQSRAQVAIAVNADSLATWFEAFSHQLLKQLSVELEILVEDQEHTWQILNRGDAIGCVSTESKSSQGFNAIQLGSMEYRCVSTPEFAQQHFKEGMTLQNAISSPAILFNRKDNLHDIFLEKLFGMKIGKYVRHYFPSPAALLNAKLEGSGYGLVPMAIAKPFLECGRLIDLAPSNSVLITLYWHHWQIESELGKKITELLVQTARESLIQDQHYSKITNLILAK
jgi:LysR family transcriptional regulator, chromosome initiation inhibitor